MAFHAPRTHLSTHEVTNQPEPLEDVNLYETDRLLTHLVAAAGGGCQAAHLSKFGAVAGAAETIALGVQANRVPPVLRAFDACGRRIDEVEFHPAYHALMAIGLEAGVASRAWTHPDGGHVAHAALLFLMSQADSGVTCPMSMTYAALPLLRRGTGIAADLRKLVCAASYDGRMLPPAGKHAATIGMAMTEKQGGSDVRANTTRAQAGGQGAYALVGHKWFCSAPMSDAFLTLAYADGGLTCFLVPRWRPDGERNAIEIQRLKDKLGDRSNASSEIEYCGAYAERIGEEGAGVRAIVEMVNHTRLDCAVGAASLMRQALSLAIHHAQGRTAFQRRLIDQPLMEEVLGSLAIEVEAAMALAFRTAEALDRAIAGDAMEAALARVLTPVAKYWVTKRCPSVVAEAMEAHGGAGYVEENLLPRLFRASPLNAIWEGSGNVVALDVVRALSRGAGTMEALRHAVADAGAPPDLAARFERLLADRADERQARALTETIAVLLCAASLRRAGRGDSAACFLAQRQHGAALFGAAPATYPLGEVLRHAALVADRG